MCVCACSIGNGAVSLGARSPQLGQLVDDEVSDRIDDKEKDVGRQKKCMGHC